MIAPGPKATARRRRAGTAAGFCLAALAAALGACAAARGGEVPLGDRRFYPSPQRPVEFHGDGNGAYAGATPVT